MTLEKGHKLGPYEIQVPAGMGGMGEVYKAKDTRLDRTVAIKVLPQSAVANPDARARFEREAKAISSLNHPNICTLYDIGHQEGVDYLVMEYIEGESLADRLKKGPLELPEVFEISAEIADALAKAHARGLIHRDIKPGNVMLTPEGAKLLDFGLARMQVSEGLVEGISGVTQSTPLTGAGTIVGTIQYMSPEQLEGREADHRSDIFALGILMFEMITGRKAFEGKSQASLIAAIIEREPISVSEIKPMTPPGLARLVRKCMSKDPEDRWQSAHDVSDELRWISQSGSQAGVSPAVAAKRRVRFRLAWLVATITTVVALGAAGILLLQPKPEPIVKRFRVDVAPSVVRATWPLISPDGKYIAYNGGDSTGTPHIWIRPLNSLDSYILPGTENAGRPFWSPDSKYLAYMQDNQLKRIAVAGGPAQFLADIPLGADGTWGSKGMILVDGSLTDSIRGVSAGGGNVFAATELDHEKSELYNAWPQFLPDGVHFLFVGTSDSSLSNRSFTLYVGSTESKERKELIPTNSMVRYAKPGYVLYVRNQVLMAQAFDAGKLELTGDPMPVTQSISTSDVSARMELSVSDEGTIAMLTQERGVQTEIVGFSRGGARGEAIVTDEAYGDVALSPDGRFLAYTAEGETGGGWDIWIRDLQRNVSSRLTFEAVPHFALVWTPGGDSLIYTKGAFPGLQTVVKPADGSGDARRLEFSDSLIIALSDVSPDGKRCCNMIIVNGQPDICVFSLDSIGSPVMIANSRFPEFAPQFSPDGNYISYASNESGKFEVYVKRSDGSGGKWQVSPGGGTLARWSDDGKQLIYKTLSDDWMAVPVVSGASFEAGTPERLFTQALSAYGTALWRWDLTPDGQELILVRNAGEAQRQTFDLVLNWVEELKQR